MLKFTLIGGGNSTENQYLKNRVHYPLNIEYPIQKKLVISLLTIKV